MSARVCVVVHASTDISARHLDGSPEPWQLRVRDAHLSLRLVASTPEQLRRIRDAIDAALTQHGDPS